MRAVGVVLVVVLCAALAPAPASAIRLEDVQLPEFHLDGIKSSLNKLYARAETAVKGAYDKYAHKTGSMDVVTDALVASINNADGVAWTAGKSERFQGVSMSEAKRMMGVRGTTKEQTKDIKNVISEAPEDVKGKIPAHFDARKHWPKCIHPIRDQGKCGSCWAFGASEALSDRLCIASAGAVDVVLSAERLVACDWEGNMGCNGGIPKLAWDYMEVFGLPADTCEPYVSGDAGKVPRCPFKCASGEKMTKYRTKLFSVGHYTTEEAIQASIMTDGPVEAAFTVYQDFMAYKGGVYSHQTGPELGGHAVKLIGWGVDKATGMKYWTVANSWGPAWGEDGFFRIQRGINECDFESGIVAGQAKVEDTTPAEGEALRVVDGVVTKATEAIATA